MMVLIAIMYEIIYVTSETYTWFKYFQNKLMLYGEVKSYLIV